MPKKVKYKPIYDHILVEAAPERSHYVCHPPGGGWVMFLSPSALHQFFEPIEEPVDPDPLREGIDEYVAWLKEQEAGQLGFREWNMAYKKLQELGLVEK